MPTSTPWNRRCATCIVRSVENPSLRLASCVSVEVVNGGAGRSTPGFCSTDVTCQGTLRLHGVEQVAGASLVEQQRGRRS